MSSICRSTPQDAQPRIFAKLNVSTRKELLVYIDMMKELNMIHEE